MNVRFGLACLALVLSCWWCTTSSVSAASNGVRPRRQSRRATLNEYLTPPAPPNGPALRGSVPRRNTRNHPPAASQPLPRPGPPSPFRHGKIMTSGSQPNSQSPGYFARLMGWLNPFGGGSPAQRPPTPSHQRPDNAHRDVNINSGYLKPPPGPSGHDAPAASYGPPSPSYATPASSYGSPTPSFGIPASAYGPPKNSYELYVPGQALPRPPLPQSSNGYQPQQPKNCNPCNEVPWIPLYTTKNTLDSRYASGSVDSKAPEVPESSTNQHSNHEQSFLPPAQLNNQQNILNFNLPQTDYRSPFTSPYADPHLYPGAMPPLFESKPFDSQPQASDNSYDPPPVSQSNNKPSPSIDSESSSSVNLGSGLGDSSLTINHGQDQYNPSSNPDPGSSMPHNHKYSQPLNHNDGTSFIPSNDQQRNEASQLGGSLDQGYLEELPPGAETLSGPGDQFPPSSLDNLNPHDNGASNSDFTQTFYGSDQQGATSVTGSSSFDGPISKHNDQKDFHVNANLKNGNQATSYGTQLSADGQHIIHYEQSPIIDLTSEIRVDKPKDTNDSSLASSSVALAIHDSTVVLENHEGIHRANVTHSAGDPTNISWPNEDGIDLNIFPVTASSASDDASNKNGQYVRFEDVHVSPSNVDISTVSPNLAGQDYGLGSTGHFDQLPRNNSGNPDFQRSGNESPVNTKNNNTSVNSNVEGSVLGVSGSSSGFETSRKLVEQSSFYPRLINSDDDGRYGPRQSDTPWKSTTAEPFIQALIKTYDNLKNNGHNNENQGGGSGGGWFDPRQVHPGSGFQPMRVNPVNSGETTSGPTDRQPNAKRNKQVQIIIPYTSQYTPEPFHPSPEDWSTRTTGAGSQARKVPIYDRHRDYSAQESRRVEAQGFLQSHEKFSRERELTRSPTIVKANTSIDVARLQKNIDNWTIQEYSRGTTISTAVPKSSRPYLSPAKKIPDDYLTTTEPVVPTTISVDDSGSEVSDVLAGFSFNDLEHEASASDQVDVSHVEVSPHFNEVSSVFPEESKSTTPRSVAPSTGEQDSWNQLPVSISPLNEERVYVVTPQTVPILSTNRNKSEEKFAKNDTTTNPKRDNRLMKFESIERAYQVLPQAVNNLAVASTGPATIPLWGIMEHEKFVSTINDSDTLTNPILYTGHSKVSHTRQ